MIRRIMGDVKVIAPSLFEFFKKDVQKYGSILKKPIKY